MTLLPDFAYGEALLVAVVGSFNRKRQGRLDEDLTNRQTTDNT